MVIMQHVVGFIIGSRIFTPFGGAGVSIFLIVSRYIILQHSINLILKLSIGLSVVFGIGYCVKFMNMAITMFVSKISYELYLVHLFVVLGLCEYFDYMFIKLLFFFSCTLLFSCMLYRFDSRVLSKFNKNNHH